MVQERLLIEMRSSLLALQRAAGGSEVGAASTRAPETMGNPDSEDAEDSHEAPEHWEEEPRGYVQETGL